MNKDLDDRLVPNNEYRNAKNIIIGKTEEGNDGAIQNSLGNEMLVFEGFETDPTLKCIGTYSDNQTNRIYQFLTNYQDTSATLDTLPPPNVYTMKIVVRDFNTQTYITLVQGDFLNFATNNAFKIYGVNVIENLLFWTDNRNQPRKINISSALNNHANSLSPYYTKDYQISVAKFAPINPISLYTQVVAPVAESIDTTSFKVLSTYKIVPGMTVISSTPAGLPIISGSEYIIVDSVVLDIDPLYNIITVYSPPIDGAAFDTGNELTFLISTMSDQSNNISWPGDPEYMKGRYIRFSYRFKFDDNEYSLFAPFTQIAYVPLQKGYFIGGNEVDAYRSTIIKWMQNNINNVDLLIELPDLASNISKSYKITEIDILYKESDSLDVKVLDTVDNQAILQNSINNVYTYRYQSRKPYRSLPSNQITRVYDQVPIRARAQEVAGNRVIYGNYIDKQTPPANLDYTVAINKKSDSFTNFIEYPNHTLKQKRNYQIGFILSDKYGRDSSVILSSVLDSTTPSGDIIFGGSTVFSDYPPENDPIQVKEWFGDTLVLQLNSAISSQKNNNAGTPGLYAEQTSAGFVLNALSTNTSIVDNIYTFTLDSGIPPNEGEYLRGAFIDYVKITSVNYSGTIPDAIYIIETEGRINDIYLKTSNIPDTKFSYNINPLGWYSYKVVVRQKEQEYYNVYLPGMLNGYPVNQTYESQVVYSTNGTTTTVNKQGHGAAGEYTIILESPYTVSGISVGDWISGPTIIPNTITVASLDTVNTLTLSAALTYAIPNGSILSFYRTGVPIGTPSLQNGINTTIFPLNETNEIAHIVLFNDNINKIPRDLIEVGPDQKQYRSSSELFGRVENILDNKFLTNDSLGSDTNPLIDEFFYDISEYGNEIITNAVPGDLLLLYDNVERTILHEDWYPGTEIISNQPTPTFGATIWKIIFTPLAPAGITWGPTPLYFGVVLPENKQYYPSRKPDIVSSISTATDFNFLETTVNNLYGSASNNLYQLQSNPSIGRISTSSSIGVPGEYMIPFLSVYETKPVVSNLDLFWETATSGFISDINSDVLNGFDGPVSVDDYNFLMFECQNPNGTNLIAGNCNSKYITTIFNPIDSSEQVVNPVYCALDTVTPLIVFDNLGNNRSTQFGIETQYSGSPIPSNIIGYRLYIKSNFVFNWDATARESYNFTVNFNFTNDDDTVTPYALAMNGFLNNNLPIINPCPTSYDITSQTTLIHTFTGLNGAYNSTDTSSLQWSMTGNDLAGNFNLNPVTGELTLINQEIPGNCYNIKITLTDAYDFTNNVPLVGATATQGSLISFVNITVCAGLQWLTPAIRDFNTTLDLNNYLNQETNCHNNGNGTPENAYPYKYGVVYIGKDDVALNSNGTPVVPGVTLPSYPLPAGGTSNVYQASINVQDRPEPGVPPGYPGNVFGWGPPSGFTQGGMLFTVGLSSTFAAINANCLYKIQESKLDLILYRRDISSESPNPNPWVADTDNTNTFTSSFSDGVDGELYIKGEGGSVNANVNRSIKFEITKPGEWALVLRLWDKSDLFQCCPFNGTGGPPIRVSIEDSYFKQVCTTILIPEPDGSGGEYEQTECDAEQKFRNFTTQLWKSSSTIIPTPLYGYPTSIPYTTQGVVPYPASSIDYTVIANPTGYGTGYINLSLPAGTTLDEKIIPGLTVFANNINSGKRILEIQVDGLYPGLIRTNLTATVIPGSIVRFQFSPTFPPTFAPYPGGGDVIYPYTIRTTGSSFTAGIEFSVEQGSEWHPSAFRTAEIGDRYYNYWAPNTFYTGPSMKPGFTNLMTVLTSYPTFIAQVTNTGNIVPAEPGQFRIATSWGAALPGTTIIESLHPLNVVQGGWLN